MSAVQVGPIDDIAMVEPRRKRLGIPFALILLGGLLSVGIAGVGKPAKVHAATGDLAVTALVDGKPVHIGGPAIALLERQVSEHDQSFGKKAAGDSKP